MLFRVFPSCFLHALLRQNCGPSTSSGATMKESFRFDWLQVLIAARYDFLLGRCYFLFCLCVLGLHERICPTGPTSSDSFALQICSNEIEQSGLTIHVNIRSCVESRVPLKTLVLLAWFLEVFIAGQAILGGVEPSMAERAGIFVCRIFIYLGSMCRILYCGLPGPGLARKIRKECGKF